jgi:uncharacterized cofD-like protein
MFRQRPDLHIHNRIVTMGGGTGSFTMLSELKKVASQLSAIVTMSDSGGSSRRLIDEFGRPLPLGDLRQALVALSRSSRLWGDMFNYRFPDSDIGTLGGHSLGNLILHSLQDLNDGDLLEALEDAAEILNTAGHVIPVTLEQSTLCAEMVDGSIVRGESTIDQPAGREVQPIRSVFLEPSVRASVRARKALERADMIIIGPGDLYTSIIPCLLVDGISEAIRSSDGEIIYVCNVMTKHGETDDFRASDFVREVHRYLGRRVDTVLISTSTYPETLLDAYAQENAFPVQPDLDEVRELVPHVIPGNFSTTDRLIRHDAERVLQGIWPDLMKNS